MIFDILTLFPDMFRGPFDESIIRRGQNKGLIDIRLHQIREHALDRHHTVDDSPYGGGAGMLMKPEPLASCIKAVKATNPSAAVLLTTPQGRMLDQSMTRELSLHSGLIIVCGRYEGVDERIHLKYADYEVSIGDYVLSGGELAAMVLVDAVTRLIPGVLGSGESAQNDTFCNGLLKHPQYTRPPEFQGLSVPDILLSGNHAEIAVWRREQSLKRTFERRPDLLGKAVLSDQDMLFLRSLEITDAD